MDSLEQIAEYVRLATGYDLEALRTKRRDTYRAAARQVFCYFARQSQHSLYKIGAFINMDHSTVVHSVRMIKEKRGIDFIIKNYVKEYEIMSKKKQIIELEPPSYNQMEESVLLTGFECPLCNGRGWVNDYGIRETTQIDCERCSGSGRLQVMVRAVWEAYSGTIEK